MKITKIEIKNFLSFKFCALKFKKNCNTIMMSGDGIKIKRELMQAISLIISPMYENILEVARLVGNPKSGYVKLIFLFNDTKTGKLEEVTAMRNFDYAGFILFSYCGKYETVSVGDFHQIFHLNCNFFPDNESTELKNLLNVGTVNLYPKQYLLEDVSKRYARILAENQLSLDSSECILMGNMVDGLMELFSLFDRNQENEVFYVTKMVADLFHYLTFGKHKVVFYVPCCPKNESDELPFLDIYFDDLSAHIVYETENEVLWHQADGLLKQLFLVSVKIIMASVLDLKTIYLNDLCKIEFSQYNDVLINSLNEISTENETSETENNAKENTNYIQRIVDVCNKKDLTVFLNVNIINYQSLKSTNILIFNQNKIIPIVDDLKDISKAELCKDFNEFTVNGTEEFHSNT